MLAWTIYISFAGALLQALLPKDKPALARALALIVALAGLVIAIAGYAAGFGVGRIVITDAAWIPTMGIRYILAADGISRVLVLLTGLASVAGVLFSWNIDLRTNQFFAFYLALIGGVYGVFLSYDLFLLFVFYEIAIVPKYFLIAIWGSTRREYGAMKLALYSFVGSAMVLIGLLAVYAISGSHSTGLVDLAHAGPAGRLPDVVFPAGLRRLRDSRRHVALPHLGAHRPRRRAYCSFHAAGRRRHEARRLRLPSRRHWLVSPRPRSMGILSARPRLLARRLRPARRHRHPLRRPGRPRANRFQIRHRLLHRSVTWASCFSAS